MSDIDPEKLEQALDIHGYGNRGENFALIVAAARAWLAQQPRFKEVEVEAWGRFVEGRIVGWAHDREEVAENIRRFGGEAVRLTGTAKVRA